MKIQVKNKAVMVSLVIELVRPTDVTECVTKALAELDKGQEVGWVLLNFFKMWFHEHGLNSGYCTSSRGTFPA